MRQSFMAMGRSCIQDGLTLWMVFRGLVRVGCWVESWEKCRVERASSGVDGVEDCHAGTGTHWRILHNLFACPDGIGSPFVVFLSWPLGLAFAFEAGFAPPLPFPFLGTGGGLPLPPEPLALALLFGALSLGPLCGLRQVERSWLIPPHLRRLPGFLGWANVHSSPLGHFRSVTCDIVLSDCGLCLLALGILALSSASSLFSYSCCSRLGWGSGCVRLSFLSPLLVVLHSSCWHLDFQETHELKQCLVSTGVLDACTPIHLGNFCGKRIVWRNQIRSEDF